MKKVFFLSMMLTVYFVSSAFAFDESAWDLEERIYLGEFSLGKANLTSEMNRGILRLGGLPNGRFVRVSVRTNRAGDVDLNTQLVEKREQTVISALRRIIPVSKLPEANVEVVTGRYDQDGVDAQGAWIEVYKPRQTTSNVSWAKIGPNAITMEDSKQLEHLQADEKIEAGIIIGSAITLSLIFVALARLLRKKRAEIKPVVMSAKNPASDSMSVIPPATLGTKQERLDLVPKVPKKYCLNKAGSADVFANFMVDGVEFYCFGKIDAEGNYPSFFRGSNGLFVADKKRRWRASVESSVRNWLLMKDKNANSEQKFDELVAAIIEEKVVITS